MRGITRQKVRAANLRLLNRTHTYRHIAEVSGTNEVYLSQIANEIVGKGRKSPRALSDDYASKIECGLGLETGWMDTNHDAVRDSKPVYAPDAPPISATAASIAADFDALSANGKQIVETALEIAKAKEASKE